MKELTNTEAEVGRDAPFSVSERLWLFLLLFFLTVTWEEVAVVRRDGQRASPETTNWGVRWREVEGGGEERLSQQEFGFQCEHAAQVVHLLAIKASQIMAWLFFFFFPSFTLQLLGKRVLSPPGLHLWNTTSFPCHLWPHKPNKDGGGGTGEQIFF